MQLTSHASSQDLTSEIDLLCDSNLTSYPLADKVRRINYSLEELISEIINADGTWQYDDTNHTDLPVGTGALVEGQESYSFAAEYLQIESIEILDLDGNRYRRIKPVDNIDLKGQGPDDYFGVDDSGNPTKGYPEWYDINGDTIRLYPAPAATSVTLAAGLKVWFKRTADLFTTSDTTQEPGLPSTHHVILAYMAAIPYCQSYKPNRVPLFEKKVDAMKKTLIKHYAHREKDRKKIIRPRRISFR